MKYALIAGMTVVLSQAAMAADSQPEPMDRMSMGQQGTPAEEPGSVAPMAEASGTIKAINTEKGTVTIAHGPVPTLKWPAMTMGFSATPEQMKGLKTGDKVKFQFRAEGMEAKILSIQPMQ